MWGLIQGRQLLLGAGLLTLWGCAGSVTGELNGDRPANIKSGFWFYNVHQDEGVILEVQLASVSGLCDTATTVLEQQTNAYQDYLEGSADAEELESDFAEIAAAYLPKEYWLTSALFLAEDQDSLVDDGYQMGGEGATAALYVYFLDSSFNFLGVFTGDSSSQEEKSFLAEDGEAEISRFTDEKKAVGEGWAEMVDGGGDDAGRVEFTFSVDFCSSYQDAWDELVALFALYS